MVLFCQWSPTLLFHKIKKEWYEDVCSKPMHKDFHAQECEQPDVILQIIQNKIPFVRADVFIMGREVLALCDGGCIIPKCAQRTGIWKTCSVALNWKEKKYLGPQETIGWSSAYLMSFDTWISKHTKNIENIDEVTKRLWCCRTTVVLNKQHTSPGFEPSQVIHYNI